MRALLAVAAVAGVLLIGALALDGDAGGGGLLAFAVVAQTIFTGLVALGLVLVRSQLALAFPPRIRVSRIVAWPTGEKKTLDYLRLFPGLPITVQAHATNVGRHAAHITESDCRLAWYPGPVPLGDEHVRRGEEPRRLTGHKSGEPLTLGPGEQARWKFDDTVPSDYLDGDGKPRLYLFVIGRVIFTDQSGRRHATYFCRCFDADTQRFVAVDDPDYESEE